MLYSLPFFSTLLQENHYWNLMIERFHGIRDSELIDTIKIGEEHHIASFVTIAPTYLIETADDVEPDFSSAVFEQLHVDGQKQIDGVVLADEGGQAHYHSSQFRLHVLIRVSDQVLDNRQNVRQDGLFASRLLQIRAKRCKSHISINMFLA